MNPITFNYTRRSKWNLDYGYLDDDLLDVYPFRSSGVSIYNRLRLTLYSLNDEFLACPNGGFKDGYFLVNEIFNIYDLLAINYHYRFLF